MPMFYPKAPNPEKWMILAFPFITLSLFVVGIILLWLASVYALPVIVKLLG